MRRRNFVVAGWLWGEDAADVFEQDEEVQGVGGGGDEVEMFVEAAGGFVFGVDGEGADAGDVGGLEGALHGVAQEGFADALALPAKVDGEAGEEHDRDGMLCEALGEARGSVFEGDVADGEGVVADDGFASEAHVGLRGAGLLVLPGIAEEITV